jgi:Fe-S oxidoreductase
VDLSAALPRPLGEGWGEGRLAADLSQCVHCGLCLPNCPTYQQTGYEAESPRGRIHLIAALKEGRVEPTPAYRQHIELCLVCRNCESVCPSGVHFGRIMEAGRAQLYSRASLSWAERLFRRLAFKELLPHRTRLRVMFAALLIYQRSGLQRLIRPLLPPPLAEAESLLPPLPAPFRPQWELYRPQGRLKYRVGLFTGCVMPFVYGDVHQATLRVLRHNGCEVHIPRDQVCCGALNVHGGERSRAAQLARQNLQAFLGRGLDAIIVNSAGCGATMKEYTELLGEADPLVREFSELVRDVTEFLASIQLQAPRRMVNRRVTLQESCHLVHAQRVKTAPRDVLAQIPGLHLREIPHADLCCGSAGLYMLTQRDMSTRILDDKMDEIAATGVDTIVTANPGCMMQLHRGVRRHRLAAHVRHVIELLDEGYA